MTLKEAKEILDADVIVGHEQLGLVVKQGGCCDLVTEIPIYGKAGMLLLTGQTNLHVIRAAHDIGAAAIVLVRGKQPPLEAIQLAEELQIPMLSTKYILFEAVGRLYVEGLISTMGRVGETRDVP